MRVSALVIWRILHKRATVWEVIDKGWAQGKGVLVEWEVRHGWWGELLTAMWKGGTLRKIGLGEEDGFEKMKEKEEELNGMRGDRKTEPALRCQLAQIHSRV